VVLRAGLARGALQQAAPDREVDQLEATGDVVAMPKERIALHADTK
jgi:hypothetical protein